MGAGADQNKVVRLARARLVPGVSGLVGAVRLGILESLVVARQLLEHFARAVNDPHRLLAPLHGEHGAGLELADVDFDRGSECARTHARLPGKHEWSGREHRSDCAGGHRRHGQELAPALVALVSHPISLAASVLCCATCALPGAEKAAGRAGFDSQGSGALYT